MKHLFTFNERLKGWWERFATFATSATFASANFVGKESCESTVKYGLKFGLKSRITTTCLRLASALTLICLLGVGNVWGAVKNISASDLNGMGSNQYASDSKIIDGFTISATGCYGTTQFRITKDKTITITCPSGNLMTGITFSTTSGYGISASNLSNQSWSDANGENSISFTHTGNSAARITNIAITYTTTASCSVDPVVQATSGSAVNVTGATISCAGITKGDCDIDEWGFVYGTATGPTGNVQKISSGKSTTNVSSFNKTLTGLDPNTKYYVRAYAKIGGNIYYGTETNFTTKKITATSSSTTYGTVSRSKMVITGTPKANCRYASPAYIISGSTPANATTVSQSGNTFTVSSTSTTDVTITINFETIPTYTLNYYDGNGAATRNSILEGTNLIEALGTPAASCDATSTTFMGWTTTEIATKTNTAPTYVSDDAVVNSTTAAATYYAVYAKGTETQTPIANSWTRITSTSQLTDGATVMLVQYYSDYAINTKPGATSCTANAEITNSNTSLRWIAEQSGTKWKFKTSAGKYLSTSALNNNTELSLDATYDEWAITVDNGGCSGSNNTYTNTNCFKLNNGSDLEYYSSTFKLYTWSLKYSSAYPFYIYIQKTNSSVSYSEYLTTCCTPLAQINGSVTVSPSRNGATVSWEKVANASGYEYKLGNEAWTEATVSDMDNPSTTISDLEGATQYSINLRATGTGNYCSEGPALDNAVQFKTLSRVTAAVNYNERGAAKVSTDNENWYASVDAADETTIYLQATPSSASWILGNWGASNGDIANSQLTNWTGDVTVTANFAAAELPTLATPTGMDKADVTAISATISWNAVANASSYAISCMPSATQGDITENDGVCSCTLTGLTAGTGYTWNVQAIGDNISYKSGAACADQIFTTEAKKPTSVEITTNPTKTVYNSGEKFDATGMVVKVTYNNGDIDAAYTGYTLSPTMDDVLTPANNKVTVSATLNEVTASADIDIVVNAKLTWKAAGADDVVTYASAGKAVLPGSNPSAPDCLGEFDTFQGWSADAIATSVNGEPSYVTAETDAAADATYYAVFARMENGGTEDASSTFTVKTSSAPGSPYEAEDGSIWTYNTTSGTINFENGNNAGFIKSQSGWIQVELPSSATEAVSYIVTKTSNNWSGDAAASLTSGSTNIATINNAGGRSYTFTNSDKGFGTYKLTNVSSTTKACYIDYITINYKKVGKVPAEWATTCCTGWDAPAISYVVPSGWKAGDAPIPVTIASGDTYGSVSYVSSNTDVLTVAANGTITAVGPGTAKVTATWAGGLDNEVKYCEALSESATITVTGTVTIHFDGNGATSGSMSDQVVTYNVAEALTANAFEKTGYTFYGWADTQEKANAGTRDYTNQQSVAFLANTTLYAVWTINSHAVTLTQPTGNTITATGAANLASVAYNTAITLSATENDGYVFTGWNATGVDLANTNPVVFNMPDDDVEVTATYSTYEWISTGYTVTTDPKIAYTKVEKFSTAGVVIKQNFKRSDDESQTKQEDYTGEWTAKLNGEVIADGDDLAIGEYTLKLYISGNEIASYTLTVSDIAADQFIDGLWEESFASQVETYTMPTPSAHEAGSVAECKDHNIFVGWVEEVYSDDPKDENIIAGGTSGQTAANKTYYAVWAKMGTVTKSISYGWETGDDASNWTIGTTSTDSSYPHTGSYSGKRGTSGSMIETKTTYSTPKSIKVYYSKSTNNTNNKHHFKLDYYTGSTWTEIVSGKDFSQLTRGNFEELSADLSAATYANKKFRVYFDDANNADGIIDDIEFTYQTNGSVDYITDCETRYEISFDANGGEGSYESVKKKEGVTIELPDGSALSKEHYDFTGWKANNAGNLLLGGSEFTVGTANVAFYAQWNEWSKATVTFKNGEETVDEPIVVYRGENYTTPAAPVIEGKQFQGWSDGEHIYGANVLVAMSDPAEPVTYNAQWADILPQPTTSVDLSGGKWILVTNTNQLRTGDMIVIAAADYNYALGTNQKTNNRNKATVTKVVDTLNIEVDVAPLFLQNGKIDGTFALYDRAYNEGEGGYLYAAASNNNYLKTQATIDENASWIITIADKKASIIAQGENTHNSLRYNAGGGNLGTDALFSCYTSGQEDITIYKWHKILSEDINVSNLEWTDAVIVADGKTLTIDEASTLDNLTVEAGGQVSGGSTLTVNNLTINSEAGKSGQVMNENVTVNGDIYLDIKLLDGTDPMTVEESQEWYCISAPFDVNMNGGFFWGDGTPMGHNVDFQAFLFDGAKRANTGVSGWQRVSGKMEAGRAYLIGFDDERTNQKTIRLKAMTNSIPNADKLPTTGHDADEANKNWNGVGNPTLHYIALDGFTAIVQCYDNNIHGYNPYSPETHNYVVGTALFMQAEDEIDLKDANNGSFRAPKRMSEENEKYSFCVEIAKEGAIRCDNRLYVSTSDEASSSYESGKDMSSMNGTSSKFGALIWTENYGMRLASEDVPMVNQKATYTLGIYAPKDGIYSIRTTEASENADLYLTKDGHIIWNLSMGACEIELAKGQTDGYGLILLRKAPSVATGVDEVQSDKVQCTKVVIDDHVYILRSGEMYDVTGKAVK